MDDEHYERHYPDEPDQCVIYLRVSKEIKEKATRLATTHKMSVNQYLTGLINQLKEKE